VPLEDVYRQLYHPALYLAAYGQIYRNVGAMTKGTTTATVDGMAEEKIRGIIALLREEQYRWTPVRRVNIPKKNNPAKTRPPGIPTWSGKLRQAVTRLILAAYYEPQFSDHAHGFRPNRRRVSSRRFRCAAAHCPQRIIAGRLGTSRCPSHGMRRGRTPCRKQ